MNLWFTSDEHYLHKNVIRLCNRPFSGLDEMHHTLIENHNALVKPEDVVFHMGDFCWNWQRSGDFVRMLNGTHHLIAGNHDACHAVHKDHEAMTKEYLRMGFASVRQDGIMSLGKGNPVALNHMPYRPTAAAAPYDLRYLDFRPKDKGLWLIHGHVHTSYKLLVRQVNVGVDQWDFKPVHADEILTILKKKS